MNRREAIGIHLILCALLAIPLHYYTLNDDKRDERFSWRMFSPVRSERCGTQFFVDDLKVRASQHFHNAWVGIAQRGRKQVILKMAQTLCHKFPGKSVGVRIQCEQTPNSTVRNRALLEGTERGESDERVELVSIGAFDICEMGVL